MRVTREITYEGPEDAVRRALEYTPEGTTLQANGLTVSCLTIPQPGDPVTDTYPNSVVPDADIQTTLKVIRTIRNACLGPGFFDADGAVVLSHAHKKIVELCERCTEEAVNEEAQGK